MMNEKARPQVLEGIFKVQVLFRLLRHLEGLLLIGQDDDLPILFCNVCLEVPLQCEIHPGHVYLYYLMSQFIQHHICNQASHQYG